MNPAAALPGLGDDECAKIRATRGPNAGISATRPLFAHANAETTRSREFSP